MGDGYEILYGMQSLLPSNMDMELAWFKGKKFKGKSLVKKNKKLLEWLEQL